MTTKRKAIYVILTIIGVLIIVVIILAITDKKVLPVADIKPEAIPAPEAQTTPQKDISEMTDAEIMDMPLNMAYSLILQKQTESESTAEKLTSLQQKIMSLGYTAPHMKEEKTEPVIKTKEVEKTNPVTEALEVTEPAPVTEALEVKEPAQVTDPAPVSEALEDTTPKKPQLIVLKEKNCQACNIVFPCDQPSIKLCPACKADCDSKKILQKKYIPEMRIKNNLPELAIKPKIKKDEKPA